MKFFFFSTLIIFYFVSKPVSAYDLDTDFPFFVLSNIKHNISIFHGKNHRWIQDVDLNLYANDFYLRNDGMLITRNVGLAHQGNAGLAVIDSQKNKVLQQLPYNNPMESFIFYDQPGLALFTSGSLYQEKGTHKGTRAGVLNPQSFELEHEFWVNGWVIGAQIHSDSMKLYIIPPIRQSPAFFQKYDFETKRLGIPVSSSKKFHRGIFGREEFYGIDGKDGTLSAMSLHNQKITKSLKLSEKQRTLTNIKWFNEKLLVLVQNEFSGRGPGSVVVVNPTSFEIEQRIEVGILPRDLCGYPELKKVFVINNMAHSISILDTESWRVIDTISSKHPQPLVIRCLLPKQK